MLLLVLTPVILFAAGIGGYVMMTQPLKPVVSLTLKAERIGVAELGERLPVIPTGDELERLSHSLNRMITRLEDALDHNRRFSADVSHELRTPLTILRGELEHVIQLPDLKAEVVDSVGSALEEIERLAKIVESLLAISRLDSGGAGIEHHPFDLAALSRMTAEQMQLLASEKQVSLNCKSTGPVQAIGDVTRIKQVLVNLLDNAIKYTRPNGHVIVSVEAYENRALLTVTDDGVGIPAESLPHVFDRFYRAEKARSRGFEGFGLGLSLVEAVCRAHGGEVLIESTEGQGTTVRVRLPVPGCTMAGGKWREADLTQFGLPMHSPVRPIPWLHGSPGPMSVDPRSVSRSGYSFHRRKKALFGRSLRFPLVPDLLSDFLHLALVVAWLVVKNDSCSPNCLSGLIL